MENCHTAVRFVCGKTVLNGVQTGAVMGQTCLCCDCRIMCEPGRDCLPLPFVIKNRWHLVSKRLHMQPLLVHLYLILFDSSLKRGVGGGGAAEQVEHPQTLLWGKKIEEDIVLISRPCVLHSVKYRNCISHKFTRLSRGVGWGGVGGPGCSSKCVQTALWHPC